ncbi:hypothetical protein B0H11DRAFT_1928391 [Mycena galericulata]|nr:hypothetical protein B0H11DRAFT_1928391 [Mycena galericulata]
MPLTDVTRGGSTEAPPGAEMCANTVSRKGNLMASGGCEGGEGVADPLKKKIYEAWGIGGDGGIGQGVKLPKPLISLDDVSKASFPAMENTKFCNEYKLGGQIQGLLENNGFDTIDGLLYMDEKDLTDAGFQLGHIAELKWALKKILLGKFGKIEGPKTERHNKPDIDGGKGGKGGDADRKGGGGGLGEAPRFSDQGQVDLFNKIGAFFFEGGEGGGGGKGGASRKGDGADGKGEKAVNGNNKSNPAETGNESIGPLLTGGRGGPGGWGRRVGGAGGCGEATEVAIERAGDFRKIGGGVGGDGGGALDQGGAGGIGRGNEFSKPLLSIDDETRGRIPTTVLKDFHINDKNRKLLQEQGFQTVGGLFEVSHNDLLVHCKFATGGIGQLTAALNKFARAS